MKIWKVIFFVWVSWSWKSSIIEHLKKNQDIQHIVSYTTRSPRQWEKDWISYHFKTLEQFDKMIQDWEFLEYKLVHWKNYYWTRFDDILQWINEGKLLIKEIEMQGLIDIIQNWKLDWNFESIFLDLDHAHIENRITSRDNNISQEEINSRLESATWETHQAHEYCNHFVDANWSLEDTIFWVEKILEKIKK